MRAYVLTDKSLERYAGRFVWLAIDTEAAENAAFLKKYPIPALPTLLVLDASKGTVALRYVGGATVPQLSKLLEDGEKAVEGSSDPAAAALARADNLASAGENAEAAKAYAEAVEKASKDWSRLGRAAESLLFTLSILPDNERCAAMAMQLYARLAGTSSGANVASTGLGCATELPDTATNRQEIVMALEKATRVSFDDPKIGMSGDDRSGLYQSLIAAREFAKDTEGATKLKHEWAAFLEGEAAKAKTPEQRAVYDSHRLLAYIDLGEPQKAIPMLEQSERDFPKDYNPPARLALAYKELKKYDEALAANDRALKLVYGPRKLGVYRTRTDIYLAKGDKEKAKETVEQAIAYAEKLPEGQRSERTIASLKKKLEAM